MTPTLLQKKTEKEKKGHLRSVMYQPYNGAQPCFYMKQTRIKNHSYHMSLAKLMAS